MSTNSVVAYLRRDGSIVSSYVHYDGYETGVGMTLLEHYNSDEMAERVSSAGYFSSLSEDMSESLGKSVHTTEADEFASMEEFEEYLMENSHLEFGYLWTGGKWMVCSWSRIGVGAAWNGFSWLVTSFVREGRKTVDRLRSYGDEYAEYSEILEEVVDRWHSHGMGEIAREAMAA